MLVTTKRQSGFTIVELLIVIVVIAILAAITIVAYNGIQERARASSVASALNQANKKIAVWQVDNPGQYPADLAAAGITNTDSVSFQYTVDNSTNPPTYCVTATTGSTSYKASSTTTTPVSGGCPGHSQGGVAAISNLLPNPSAEVNLTAWTASYGTGGAGTMVRQTDGGATGSSYVRQTWSTAPTGISAGAWTQNSTSGVIAEGNTYSASAFVRPSKAQRMAVYIYWINSSGAAISTPVGAAQVVPANTWTRLTITGQVAPVGAVRFFVVPWSVTGTGYSAWAASDTLDTDGVMMTQVATPPTYADGSSANWVWSGTAHNSTSTGPPL